MKTINLKNTVLFCENGDYEAVRRLRDALAARLRHFRVDVASIAPAQHSGQKVNGVSYKEASVHSYITSENRVTARRAGEAGVAFVESLKTLYAAAIARVGV